MHFIRMPKPSHRRLPRRLPITRPAKADPPPQNLDRVFKHTEHVRYERRTRHYQRQLEKCFIGKHPWDDGQTIARARIDDQGFRRRHEVAIASRALEEGRAQENASFPVQDTFGTSTFVNGALEDPFGPLLSGTVREDAKTPEVLESYKVPEDMRRRIELERYSWERHGG